MRKLIIAVYFRIGVNIIGIPEIVKHNLGDTIIPITSKFHK